MSELDYEAPPALEVNVPKVRRWLRTELRRWRDACYAPHGFTIVWGVFVLPWLVWQALKFFIFAVGAVLMVAFYPFWITAELITFRYRRRRTQREVWTKYLLALHEQGPPQAA